MDFDSAEKFVSQALVRATRAVNTLASEDIPFQRSSNPSMSSSIDSEYDQLLSLGRRLVRRAPQATLPFSFKEAIGTVDPQDSGWRRAVDVLDALLEKADSSLDEYNGLRFNTPSIEQQPPAVFKSRPSRPPKPFRTQNLDKPQLGFAERLPNHATEPFKPLLTHKPNANVRYDDSFQMLPNEFGALQYQHPYQNELIAYEYPSSASHVADPISYRAFNQTNAIVVEDFDGVLDMLDKLRQAKEIAIDLEHHDAHSYLGIVSLMQISTRESDWIIDTLKPWRRKLEVLNEVFTNPKIVKVLHGAHSDIIWLQRDFGLYIVGLFDTYYASCALGYSGHSLAFLLKRFIDFDAKKEYQMADWRIRPLPQELLDYARSDTHFLLYIYDQMRNELVRNSQSRPPDEDKIQYVLEKSKETCLQRFEHPFYDEQGHGPNGWLRLLHRNAWHGLHSTQQLEVFRALHKWRDSLARHEDENPFLIMPNHVLLNIAREIPQEIPKLLSMCHPISEFVRREASQLLEIVQKAAAISGFTESEPTAPFSVSKKPQSTNDQGFTEPSRTYRSEFWGGTWVSCLRGTAISGTRVVSNLPYYTISSTNMAFYSDLRVKNLATGAESSKIQNPEALPPSPAKKRTFEQIIDRRNVNTTENDSDELQQKLRSKLDRKFAKRKGKAPTSSMTSEDSKQTVSIGSDEIDYNKEPSVLHPGVRGNGLSSSVVTPYVQASEGSSGLKKPKLIVRERAKTFKS